MQFGLCSWTTIREGGGKVVGKWEKVGCCAKLMHTCSHMITQQTAQNTAFDWQQGLAITIVYIIYLNSMY